MESGKKSLEELTTAGVFHIPDYQRYYSWKKPEWSDLWTDLSTLPDGKQHYFGTIIIQKTNETETAQQIDGYGGETEKNINLLIDGQQRLTSLTLLAKSMIEFLEQIAPKTAHEEEILNDVEEMRKKILVEDNIYFLKLLDGEDSEYLERIIDGRNLSEPERPSQRKMIEAKEYFDDQLEELWEQPEVEAIEIATELKQLWETILDLELMVYVVDAENPEKATLIFDSVNDRGRALSTFDKTKSFLMRMAYLAAEDEDDGQGTIRQIRQAFGQMYDDHQRMIDSPYIDDIEDDAVQRYHFITFFDWSDRQDHQTPAFLENLKSHVRSLREKDPEACLEYIQEYVESLERAFDNLGNILSHRKDDEIADLIDRIHKLRHATKFYPLLLKAWPHLDREGRRKLLDAIETYIFRVYAVGNHPTYTGRSSLQTLARDTTETSSINVWIHKIVNIMHRYENDSQFRRVLSSSDLYTNVTSQDLRYLFYFYNEHRAVDEGETGSISLDDAMGENYTIEHIWPQSPDELPIEEPGDYPSAQARYDAYKHRFGNLTLASKSWNSKWGNKDFQTKRDEGYEKSKLWVQWDLQDYDEWSVKSIGEREERLIQFVMDKWDTPRTHASAAEW
ncbi:DUF262 domain-containing protein [Natronorubrum daqingense]|uniref:Uncharacterized conserved protein, contains ParB-like and HNH nuclease domains n=1 Tax=Natronorubrum daqingense TaxID=588898 RepID=A0A1N7CAV0_9EURY|nr:DUF262 domain-containing protein [Natronorubrum daqingense]SIR60710.1 Uncharacterized conserved protein, contains ParB-like and HNH nuclease domains [Natronorubrum daqingense]